MPKYTITAPDGKKYNITAPEGTSQEDALEYFKQNWQPEERNPVEMTGALSFDPTEGMSGTDKFLAGAGKAFVDIGRGAKQLVGLGDQAEIDESKKRDAALMDTGAGKWGNVAGNTAALLPTLLIPGANTYTGAALTGAVAGALQPTTSEEGFEGKAVNTALGALAGAGGQAAGNAVAGAVRGAKAIADPLFKGGRARIAARVLQKFSQNADDAARAAGSYSAATPGVAPTLAEATLDPGIATLQRSLADPQLAGAVTNRGLANRKAMIDALSGIAQDDAARSAAVSARQAAAEPLYSAAKAAIPAVDDAGAQQLAQLLSRPSMEAAEDVASKLAAEEGVTLGPELTGQKLHYLKMAMDNLLDPRSGTGIVGAQANAVRDTRNALVGWMDQYVPSYQAARETYAELSKPIGQMDIGRALYDKLVPALSEAGDGVTRFTPQKYAQALRDADTLARNATDFPGATLEKVMTPEQIATLKGIGTDLGRAATAADIGRAVGSNTSQNLAAQNVVDQVLGPLSVGPRARAMAEALLYPTKWTASKAYSAGLEPEIQQELARLLLDPQAAAAALRTAPTAGVVEGLGEVARRASLPLATGAYMSQ